MIDLTDSLAPDEPRRHVVAEQIRAAAETCGFFYVSGHGISAELVRRQFAVAKQFFQSPTDVKQAVSSRPDGAMRGYGTIGSQTLDAAAHDDIKESYQCGWECAADHPYVLKGYSSYGQNLWPEGVSDFRETCELYMESVNDLSRTLLQLLALSLELSEDYFQKLNVHPSDTLRLLWYPPHSAKADSRTFGAGKHTDWGAITILAQDANGGLEIQMRDGSWVSADPVDGTFVVNLGDMIPRWTNGLYHSNFHRVINKSAGRRNRQSVVFFTDLDFEAFIEPIPGAQSADRPPLLPPCTVGEHMVAMVQKTYG
ncbi:isopenicillin N synthase-like dioxygenase [Sphingobium boeckii]|uniref:2-oxoglutarate-dependent ethylene/succinate-forming enzyme n=1 Tax=Sphingobium boeckii TaxID=1082345 RepID=A0A7W9AH99_9SPHN|nr:isopenicillin N synthase-like dioxygenase [Sphingobium boeckii]